MRNITTTLELINSKTSNPNDLLVNVQGYAERGSGGAAQWKHNGVTGQTPSQSPAQLGDALLNDASGNQWELVAIAGTNLKEINANALGAVGDFDYGTLTGTDNVPVFNAAFNAATQTIGTAKVTQGAGQYLFDTDTGTVNIPESVEWVGIGGIQVRRPTSAQQTTKLCIRGTVNSPFTFERGCIIRGFNIDYPDQEEDPVTPVTYPFCFQGAGTQKGARSNFKDLFFDRTFRGVETSGGTMFGNVHGQFYSRFIKITDSAALSHIINCSTSGVWHNTTNTNTNAYMQDNLVLFEINGGTDGMIISTFTAFTAKVFISLVNGDGLNFFRVGDFLLDGVMDPVTNDGTVSVKSAQFSNGYCRLNNEWGSTFRQSAIVFDGPSDGSFTDQVVEFSNVRFKVVPGGVISVESGVDKLVMDGCTFADWNKQDNGTSAGRSAIHINDADCALVVNGGGADCTTQFDLAVETRLVNIQNAKRVTVNGMDLNKIQKLFNIQASVVLNRLTSIGNTGDDITTEVSLGGGASVTNQVLNNNI